jgi:hypothetical protein
VETKLSFAKFKPSKLQVPISRPRYVEGFPFELELGSKLVQKMGSFIKGSKKSYNIDKYTKVYGGGSC